MCISQTSGTSGKYFRWFRHSVFVADCDPVFWWIEGTAQQCAAGTLNSCERFPSFPWVVLSHILGRQGTSFCPWGQNATPNSQDFWKIYSLISHSYSHVLLLSKQSYLCLSLWSWCFRYLGWFAYPPWKRVLFFIRLMWAITVSGKGVGISTRIKNSSVFCNMICMIQKSAFCRLRLFGELAELRFIAIFHVSVTIPRCQHYSISNHW